MLLTIIDRKLKYFDEKLVEINTHEARANQFNHFDSKKVQRDMYSTFLIMNVNSDLKSFNTSLMLLLIDTNAYLVVKVL